MRAWRIRLDTNNGEQMTGCASEWPGAGLVGVHQLLRRTQLGD